MSDLVIALIYGLGSIFGICFLIYMRLKWKRWFHADALVAWLGWSCLAFVVFYGIIGTIILSLSAIKVI